MGDAWTAPVGQRPIQPDIASIIRNAQTSSEHVEEEEGSSQVGLEGVSFRHTEVSTGGGGAQANGAGNGAAVGGRAPLMAPAGIELQAVKPFHTAPREPPASPPPSAGGGSATVAVEAAAEVPSAGRLKLSEEELNENTLHLLP